MSESRVREGFTYHKPDHIKFIDDMEAAGLDVRYYAGRFFYHGPAVSVDDLQDAMRETKVSVGWDQLGKGYIVHPTAGDPSLETGGREAPKSQTDRFKDRYGV